MHAQLATKHAALPVQYQYHLPHRKRLNNFLNTVPGKQKAQFGQQGMQYGNLNSKQRILSAAPGLDIGPRKSTASVSSKLGMHVQMTCQRLGPPEHTDWLTV